MQKISSHLWFDKEAKEAAAFYTSLFDNSKIKSTWVLHNTPSGDVDWLTIVLAGMEFTFINAGPVFKFNPSVSYLVACKTEKEVDNLWKAFSKGGTPLMDLGAYPFSKKYGWIQDRYGLSWQIMFMGDRKVTQKIIPTLMFVGKVCGKAEEAMNFYASVFKDAKIGEIMRYEKGEKPDKPGTIKHAEFTLEGVKFAAMDSAYEHDFMFNEAISFVVYCETQKEIDYFWEKLSAVPESEQCGWLKDKYGFSWQIVPNVMDDMMKKGDERKIARLTEAFLKMKKFDIAALKKVYDSN